MIWGLLGETGDGKNLYASWLAWQSYQAGVEIFANYHLNFPYTFVKDVRQLEEIDSDRRILVLLDGDCGVWDAMDSQSEITRMLVKCVLQVRKRGLTGNCLHLNQHESAIVRRLRVNTSLYLKPHVVLSYNEATREFSFEKAEPGNGLVPFMMAVRFEDKFFRDLGYYEVFRVYPAHLFYNTREVLKPMRQVDYEALAVKYRSFVGGSTQLAAVLERLEGLTRRDARGFAVFLKAMAANEYLEELKPRLPPGRVRRRPDPAGRLTQTPA